jgi:hypothetical protein
MTPTMVRPLARASSRYSATSRRGSTTDGLAGGLVGDEVGGLGEAVEVVLGEDHAILQRNGYEVECGRMAQRIP